MRDAPEDVLLMGRLVFGERPVGAVRRTATGIGDAEFLTTDTHAGKVPIQARGNFGVARGAEQCVFVRSPGPAWARPFAQEYSQSQSATLHASGMAAKLFGNLGI